MPIMNTDDSSEGMSSGQMCIGSHNLVKNKLQTVPGHSSLLSLEGIPDLLEPLQEPESNLSSLISLASVLLSSPPLPPPFIHPSSSHLCTLSPCGMLDL